MPEPFLRIVESLEPVKTRGTDESFYRGENYLRLSHALIDSIRSFCGRKLASIELGPEDDDQLRVFNLPLSGEDGKKMIIEFNECLEVELRKILQDAIINITAGAVVLENSNLECLPQKDNEDLTECKTIFSRKLDTAFDLLRMAVETRDFLLKVEGRLAPTNSKSKDTGPFLLIEV